MLPLSEACERNKGPILEVLRSAFAHGTRVLEIGSGTGQHAVYFAQHLPHLSWQPTELRENVPDLAERIRLEGGPNVRAPLALDVRDGTWVVPTVDCVFTANTLHIVSPGLVREFFRGVKQVLEPPGVLCIYGPFNYGGRHTSESNAAFDRYLRVRDAASGIRDFEAIELLAKDADLTLESDHDMPANNRTLVWKRS
jgi:cyclopropane fatty-acyl-phospholipid synthase-like methyltransferase